MGGRAAKDEARIGVLFHSARWKTVLTIRINGIMRLKDQAQKHLGALAYAAEQGEHEAPGGRENALHIYVAAVCRPACRACQDEPGLTFCNILGIKSR